MPLSVFILEIACPSASWTVGPVLLQVLPSFPSWALCPMNRMCPFQKWLSLVSMSSLHAHFSFIICKEVIEDMQIRRKNNVFFLPICFGNYFKLRLELDWWIQRPIIVFFKIIISLLKHVKLQVQVWLSLPILVLCPWCPSPLYGPAASSLWLSFWDWTAKWEQHKCHTNRERYCPLSLSFRSAG